jgi:FkbM family methyltransferase
MIKAIIKKIVGQNLIDKLRSINAEKPSLVIPIEDKLEVELRVNFYKQFIDSGDLVFDVGANVGNRITPLLEIGANVIAVEPQEYCIKVLEAKFGNKITIVKNGLGEKEEKKDFYIADASTISSFSTEWIEAVKKDRFKEFNWKAANKIQLTTMDKLISTYGLPKFVKIDVEGYELEVLKGLTQIIPLISYEYTTPEQTDKALACLNLLHSITPKIECNYSVGESMNFELSTWKTKEEMEEIINSSNFISTGFGDIYIRSFKD